MILFAIVLLMAATALFTAAAGVQVQKHTDKKMRYVNVGSMEPDASLWLSLPGILLVTVGSFLYSQSQGTNPTGELVLFLAASIGPVPVITFIHNRKIGKKQATG